MIDPATAATPAPRGQSPLGEVLRLASYAILTSFLQTFVFVVDRALLGRWYARETLESPQARTQFVLPDPRPQPEAA